MGSLTNNSYIEGKGRDIDLITVLYDDVSLLIKKKILDEISTIENKFNNDLPIAKTIYYLSDMLRPFKSDFPLIFENKHRIELTVELQRIHESGLLLYGDNIISTLPVPTKEEYIYFDKLGREFNKLTLENDEVLRKSYEEFYKNPPIHLLIQSILTNAFRHYFYATGKTCCNKHVIYQKMNEDVPNYKYIEMLKIATMLKINPNMNVSQELIEQIKMEFYELKQWQKNNEVYEVPYTSK